MHLRLLVCLFALSLAPQGVIADAASSLGESMEAIGDAFKPLYRGLVRAPDSDQIEQYLGWTRTIKAEAVKARAHTPELAATLAEAARATLIKDYQADMDTFIQQIEALEKALLSGNLTQAQALAKKLRVARNEGHDKYQEE